MYRKIYIILSSTDYITLECSNIYVCHRHGSSTVQRDDLGGDILYIVMAQLYRRKEENMLWGEGAHVGNDVRYTV